MRRRDRVDRARIAGGTLRAGDDAAEAGFFALDELPSNIAFASTRRALLRWRLMKDPPRF
jgi:hypothetical protein